MKKVLQHHLLKLFCFKFVTIFSLIILLYGALKVVASYLSLNTKTIPPNGSETCRDNSLPFCNISDDIQFEKFFLMALDGVSFEFLQPLLDIFEDHAQVYSTHTDLNRYTQSIFRTWLTGRDNINLQPFPIPEDTIMLSFLRTYGKKPFLLGRPNWYTGASPIPPKEIYYEMDIFYDSINASAYRAYNTILNKKNEKRLIKDLKIIEENGLSVMGYEGHMDDIQHEESAKTNCSNYIIAPSIVKHLAEDIIPIKEWIDNHPDYVFIISADHGHDEIVPEDNPKQISLPYVKEFSTSSQTRYYFHGGYTYNNSG